MSANVAGQGPAAVITIEGGSVGAGGVTDGRGGTDSANNTQRMADGPITITRRILVSIQGSRLDFSQDGQGCATWRPVEVRVLRIHRLRLVLG